jgi:hypothetical protein
MLRSRFSPALHCFRRVHAEHDKRRACVLSTRDDKQSESGMWMPTCRLDTSACKDDGDVPTSSNLYGRNARTKVEGACWLAGSSCRWTAWPVCARGHHIATDFKYCWTIKLISNASAVMTPRPSSLHELPWLPWLHPRSGFPRCPLPK